MIFITHVIYAVALLTFYYFTLGVIGLFCGVGVLIFWAIVFYSENRAKVLTRALVYLIVAAIFYGLLMPAGQMERAPTRRSTCTNNLKQIMVALHNYHEIHDSFPPAYLADEEGKPVHSWRVLLLPYLGEQKLYAKYDFTKPWDSWENRKLLNQMPNFYSCPSHHPVGEEAETTSYVAVVGLQTAWPGSQSTKLNDLNDGPSSTILVVESDSDIPWTAPQDVSMQEAVERLSSRNADRFDGHRSEDFFHKYFYGRHVAFADGRIGFSGLGLDRKLATELLNIDDGQPAADFDLRTAAEKSAVKTKWRNVILFAICMVLTAMPLPWVWWNPKIERRRGELDPEANTAT